MPYMTLTTFGAVSRQPLSRHWREVKRPALGINELDSFIMVTA